MKSAVGAGLHDGSFMRGKATVSATKENGALKRNQAQPRSSS